MSRLTDGTSATFGDSYILPRLQLCIDDLEQQGVSLILFLCTGEFPAEFRSNVPLIFPDHILKGLIPAIGVCDGIAMGHVGMKYSHRTVFELEVLDVELGVGVRIIEDALHYRLA